MDALREEARRLGVRVVRASLRADELGLYSPARHTIYLDLTLTRAQFIETLAHELGHAYYGHDCSSPQSERQAWRRAALLTVDPDGYREAEALCPGTKAIAARMELTEPLVAAWETYWLPSLAAARSDFHLPAA